MSSLHSPTSVHFLVSPLHLAQSDGHDTHFPSLVSPVPVPHSRHFLLSPSHR